MDSKEKSITVNILRRKKEQRGLEREREFSEASEDYSNIEIL